MMNQIKKFMSEEEGQGMTEYGLILGLVALAAVVALTTMGDTLKGKFETVIDKLKGTTTPTPTTTNQ